MISQTRNIKNNLLNLMISLHICIAYSKVVDLGWDINLDLMPALRHCSKEEWVSREATTITKLYCMKNFASGSGSDMDPVDGKTWIRFLSRRIEFWIDLSDNSIFLSKPIDQSYYKVRISKVKNHFCDCSRPKQMP